MHKIFTVALALAFLVSSCATYRPNNLSAKETAQVVDDRPDNPSDEETAQVEQIDKTSSSGTVSPGRVLASIALAPLVAAIVVGAVVVCMRSMRC